MPLGFALTLPAYRPGPSLSRQAGEGLMDPSPASAGEGGARRASGGRVRAALAALLFLAAGPAWADEATETRL
ncbi:hypothetical protein, partial [Telmatospirillum siberiense]